jgi:hypothetical protein
MFQTFYNDKSNILFKMFNEIYSSNDQDLINKFRLFEQITIPINKKIFNNYIMLKHRDDIFYTKNDNVHTIENDKEISRLTINNTFLKIKSNKNINSFIKDIYDSKESVFVIDFQNKDYFWINEIKLKTLV